MKQLRNFYDPKNFRFCSQTAEDELIAEVQEQQKGVLDYFASLLSGQGDAFWSVGRSQCLSGVSLELNERDEILETYGGLSLEQILEAVEDAERKIWRMRSGRRGNDIWHIVRKIKRVLKQMKVDEDAGKQTQDGALRELIAALRETVGDDCHPLLRKAVRDLLSKLTSRKFSSVILGCFDKYAMRIILYLKPICKAAADCGATLEDVLMVVFAHEYFHYIHYIYIRDFTPQEIRWPRADAGNGYYKNVVIESLASAVEYFYAAEILHCHAWCRDQWKEWQEHDVSIWPYSGAFSLVDKETEQAMLRLANSQRIKARWPHYCLGLVFAQNKFSWEEAYKTIDALTFLREAAL